MIYNDGEETIVEEDLLSEGIKMKKSEFKQLLKKHNHPVFQEITYYNILTIVYVVIVAFYIVLIRDNILPVGMVMYIILGLLIFVSICLITYDLKEEQILKQMLKHYQEKNEILKVPSRMRILRLMFLLELVIALFMAIFACIL